MLYRVRHGINRVRLRQQLEAILETPPLETAPAPLRIVSMVCSRDVIPYLVAIKSFYRQLGRGEVVIVNDGTLTERDQSVLNEHIPGIRIRPISDGVVGGLPTGGTWERLCVLADEAKSNYAIQLDADIVCTGPLDDVQSLIDQNRPFALADNAEPGVATLAEIDTWQKENVTEKIHIQDAAESVLDHVGLPASRKYLKGTSAFVGLPRGSDVMPLIREFHNAMSVKLGPRWAEWGTEQITSNYVVANCCNARALSSPAYVNHTPTTTIDAASIIHFFGTYRYHNGRYGQIGCKLIEDMRLAVAS